MCENTRKGECPMKKKRCFAALLSCIMLWQTPVFGVEQEELSPPEYRCTIDNPDEEYESGDWNYGFTVEEEPLFYLKDCYLDIVLNI